MTDPKTISSANVNRLFEQDWKNVQGGLDRPVPLELTPELAVTDPEGFAFLSMLNADQRAALVQADKNRDGSLTMREARDYLIKNRKVRRGGQFERFEDALNHLFTFKAGRTIDVTEANASVCYLQFNNNTQKGSYLYNAPRQAAEKRRLNAIVRKDSDKPDFHNIDTTKAFNTSRAEAQRAFREGFKKYLDNLLKTGGSMTGLIVSGHSGGGDMLFESAPHEYKGRLDIRGELMRFRNMEEPPGSGKHPYRKLFDACEKVGLLACYQGGQAAAWSKIFPKATIAGTQGFAPDSGDPASAAIYDAAARGHQHGEEGGTDPENAQKAALTAPHVGADLIHKRGLRVRPPDAAAARRVAQNNFIKARDAYNTVRAEIEKVVREGGSGVSRGRLKQLYNIARKYQNATQTMHEEGLMPREADGTEVDLPTIVSQADRLFELRQPGRH